MRCPALCRLRALAVCKSWQRALRDLPLRRLYFDLFGTPGRRLRLEWAVRRRLLVEHLQLAGWPMPVAACQQEQAVLHPVDRQVGVPELSGRPTSLGAGLHSGGAPAASLLSNLIGASHFLSGSAGSAGALLLLS